MNRVVKDDFKTHLAAHTQRWAQRWAKSDVVIDGDPPRSKGFGLISRNYL